MKVSAFESRHAVTIHQAIVAAAFGMYFLQRDDVVWQFVKNSEAPVQFERSLFALATLLVGVAAFVCTKYGRDLQFIGRNPATMGGEQRSRGYGELLYAIGLGSLAPLAGFVILVGGEALHIFRLMAPRPVEPLPVVASSHADLQNFAPEFAKWGMFATMTVFTITLNDRVAEVLATIVFVSAITLNLLPIVRYRRVTH